MRDEMTVRRLWVLISRLPPESATQIAVSGRPGEGVVRAEWTTTNHLLAAIQEQLQLTNHMYAAAHTERGRRNPVPAPQPIPRPGVKEG